VRREEFMMVSLRFVGLGAFALALVFPVAASADGGGLESLKGVKAPLPNNLGKFVVDRDMAKVLGKALFWDEQAGGDGAVACASCHWSAGADTRSTNTVNPHGNGVFEAVAGAGEDLSPAAFPIANDDVSGSQGVSSHTFTGLSGGPVDDGIALDDPTFGELRRVTGRNTPSNINAAFNEVQFHDGRAAKVFNGVNPAGTGDPDAKVWMVRKDGTLGQTKVRLDPASLASQAVGPPNNAVEMSFDGRTWPELGRKMLGLQPLALQDVAADDSILGPFADGGSGLDVSYADLIRASFSPRFWDSAELIDGFTLMEQNFTLFWGLSIMLYETELISDDSPFDNGALTASQSLGMEVFMDSDCDSCHRDPEFTAASLLNGSNGNTFAYIGVRPVAEDTGKAGTLGEIKVSTLRNTELNGPYMHNGGFATLRQVVDFYDRGGDFPNDELDPLGLSEGEKVALVDFLLSLTDERVRFGRAPFDHPQLHVPNGPTLDALGAGGGAPVGAFLGLSPHTP
jgi:cytochrome c peroxidase